MFGGIGMWEVLLVFLVALLLFGAKRLPEIGSSLGKGIREFKGSLREIEGEFKLQDDSRGGNRSVSGSRDPYPPREGTREGESDREREGEPRRLSSTAPEEGHPTRSASE